MNLHELFKVIREFELYDAPWWMDDWKENLIEGIVERAMPDHEIDTGAEELAVMAAKKFDERTKKRKVPSEGMRDEILKADFARRRCPLDSELSLAMTRFQDAMGWANADVARNASNVTKRPILHKIRSRALSLTQEERDALFSILSGSKSEFPGREEARIHLTANERDWIRAILAQEPPRDFASMRP